MNVKNPQLATMLRKVGDNPLVEPELFALLKEDDPMYNCVEFVVNRAEKTIKELDADNSDLALFFYKVKGKVSDFKDEKDNFKQTAGTKELDALDFKHSTALGEMYKDLATEDDGDGDDSVQEKMKAYALKHCNLDTEKLSEWEKDLIALQLMAASGDERQLALLGNLMTS